MTEATLTLLDLLFVIVVSIPSVPDKPPVVLDRLYLSATECGTALAALDKSGRTPPVVSVYPVQAECLPLSTL